MALWIKANGDTATVKPENGKAFTLPEMQKFVGGYIEALRLENPPGGILWLNEDGKRLELHYNYIADLIAKTHTGIARDDHIVGDCLFAGEEESGEGEEEEEEDE